MLNKLNMPSSRVRKGLRISIIEGSFASIHLQLTGGIFLSGFALYLGASDFQIGVLSAIPALLTIMSFLTIPLVRLFGNRKKVVILTAGVGRGLFFIPAILIFLGKSIDIRWMLLLLGAFNTLLVIANNTWTSWMSDIVPKNRWGRYFGLRNMIVGGIGIAVSFAGGLLLDVFKRNKITGQGFAWIFLIAAVASTISAILLIDQPYPAKPLRQQKIVDMFTIPFKDKKFKKLILFLAFWHLTSGIASPFFGVHMLDKLRMTYSQAAIYAVIAGISGLVFQLIWGKIIDKFHAKPVLQISYAGVAFMPLLWLIASPSALWPIWIDSFFSGIFWTGISAALFNILLGSVDKSSLKESYIAVFTVIIGICGFLSGIVGGSIAEMMSNFHLTIWGRNIINYHVLFAASSVFRFLSLILLARLEDSDTPNLRLTLAAIGSYTLRRLSPGKGLRLRSINLGSKRQNKKNRV